MTGTSRAGEQESHPPAANEQESTKRDPLRLAWWIVRTAREAANDVDSECVPYMVLIDRDELQDAVTMWHGMKIVGLTMDPVPFRNDTGGPIALLFSRNES